VKVGVAYEQGDFGTGEESRSVYAPLTLKYLGERFDVGIAIPFLYLESEEGVTQIDGQLTQGRDRRRESASASGLGDIILKGRWFLVDDRPGSWVPAVTPVVRLKLPTADADKNLGTGEVDYGAAVEFDKQVGRLSVFGDVSYTIIGDPPGENLRNRPGVSIGVGYDLTPTLNVSALLDWRRAIVARAKDPVDLIGTLLIRLSPTMSLMPAVLIGLSDGSPDFGVGVELAYKFGRY
jgi:hypothetical protein